MVLGVNPGHAGRKYLPYIDKKILKLIELKKEYNFEIYIDGAVTAQRIDQWRNKGVKGFVLGTATLFNKENDFRKCINDIRQNGLIHIAN